MQTQELGNKNSTLRSADLSKNLEKDGFVMFRNFFDPVVVAQAHEELESWYKKDLEERKEKGITDNHWDGVSGYTILTEPSHLMNDVYGKSPALDSLFEKFLTDSTSQPVVEALAGKNIKLRGYNVRRMTGKYNPPPAHEWHRDSFGEFGFGILLTDVGPHDNGATAFVPGSHLFPYCPRWNCLFYVPPRVLSFFYKYNVFSRLLGSRVLKNATGASGIRGDAYIFINDIWHGRQPNLHGKESMVVLIGAFPTEYEFPDEVKPPSDEVLKTLPPSLADVASGRLPANEEKSTILRRMIENRMTEEESILWKLARKERQFSQFMSKPIFKIALFLRQQFFKTLSPLVRTIRKMQALALR